MSCHCHSKIVCDVPGVNCCQLKKKYYFALQFYNISFRPQSGWSYLGAWDRFPSSAGVKTLGFVPVVYVNKLCGDIIPTLCGNHFPILTYLK